MNYAELYTKIIQYTENDEETFVANIPTFVENTETLINNTVQLPAFRTNVTGTATEDFQYVALPLDFLSIYSVAVINGSGQYGYLLNKDVNYIRECFPFPGVTGLPTTYAIFDNTSLLLGPTPDDAYSIELHYYAYPQSIVTAGTSWIGDNYPNVLLWGALVEAYTYMKGEQDLIQQYQNKYSEAMMLLKQLGDGKDRQDNYRTTQVRQQVQ